MKHCLLFIGLLASASPAFAQSVLPQLRMDRTGTEKQISVRDPQAGVDVLFGSILNGSAIPPRTTIYNNPALAGGLFGIGDNMSLTNQIETYNLSATRTKAAIGRTIIVNDSGTSPAAGPGTASYGLSIFAQRPNWNTSGATGEMDPINLVVRQASGDSAGILSNILTRNGFGATLESYTGTADSSGAVTKAVNTQLGVSNSRDGTNYGLIVQSAVGTGLNAGIRVAQTPGTSWANYMEFVSPAGSLVSYLRGADGAFFGGSFVPLTNFGGNLGAPTNVFANTFTRNLSIDMQVFASLPACGSSSNGNVAYISDASAAITTWGQVVTAGGGSARAYLTCDGTNWRAFSL